ncbi:MAG: hypothetical protein WDA60_04800 [Acidimicrobiia bacterium]
MANSTGGVGPAAGDGASVVVDADAARAGRTVRARLDAGARAAGFVGDASADAEAIAAFVADVIRLGAPSR